MLPEILKNFVLIVAPGALAFLILFFAKKIIPLNVWRLLAHVVGFVIAASRTRRGCRVAGPDLGLRCSSRLGATPPGRH
jgi:hypothetical protein